MELLIVLVVHILLLLLLPILRFVTVVVALLLLAAHFWIGVTEIQTLILVPGLRMRLLLLLLLAGELLAIVVVVVGLRGSPARPQELQIRARGLLIFQLLPGLLRNARARPGLQQAGACRRGRSAEVE